MILRTRRLTLQRLTLLAAGAWPARPAVAQQQPAGEAGAGPVPPVGTLLELPSVPLLDAGSFQPAQAQGRVLVLYWWASWCPFCAVQSPLMEKLWQTQRGRGLLMLGLSIDKDPSDAQAHRTLKGYTFPCGWVSPEVAKALPKPRGLPVTYVRGRDGRLRMAEAGQLFPEDIEQIARFL
jgi:hypothetical protein